MVKKSKLMRLAFFQCAMRNGDLEWRIISGETYCATQCFGKLFLYLS